MGKNREFVGNFGTAADLLQKLAQDVYARRGNDEALRLVISDDVLRGRLADLTVKAWQTEPDVYEASVDRILSLSEIIAAGRYDSADHNICEKNFPLSLPPPPTASPAIRIAGRTVRPERFSTVAKPIWN